MNTKVLMLATLLFQADYAEAQQMHMLQTTIVGGKKPSYVKQLQATSDGGVLVVGHTQDSTGTGDLSLCNTPSALLKLMVSKIDSNGNKEWVKVYCDYSAQVGSCPPDHPGYAVGGLDPISPDMLLTKLDCQGNVQWQKRWGSTNADDTKNVIRTKDGGFLLLGVTLGNDGDIPFNYNTSTSILHGDIVLIKTDNAGNKEWLKIYGSSTDDFSSWVYQVGDYFYMVAGTDAWSNDHDFSDTNPYPGNSYCYLMKIDSLGNVVSSKSVGNLVPSDVTFDSRDSSFIIVTTVSANVPPINKNDGNTKDDYGVAKIDLNGQVVWGKHYGDATYTDLAYGVSNGPGHSYLIVGQSLSEQFSAIPPRIGYLDGLVYWIDSVGNEISRKFFGTTEIEEDSKICPLKGNKILIGLTGGAVPRPYTEGLWYYGSGVTYGASFSVLDVWPTSVSNLPYSKYNALKVYPNPTTGVLKIEVPEKHQELIFRMYSEDGKLLKQFSTPPGKEIYELETREWTTGVYVITCSGVENYVTKVQLQH